jgi:hypothetical protein
VVQAGRTKKKSDREKRSEKSAAPTLMQTTISRSVTWIALLLQSYSTEEKIDETIVWFLTRAATETSSIHS